MTEEVSPADERRGPDNRPELRASHGDRDQTVEILRDAAGDGQLTAAELDERLETALTARTRSELAELTADLRVVAERPAKELVKIDQRFGDAERTGRWVVPQRMQIKSTAGDVRLDFTEAEITHDTLHIEVELGIGADLLLVTRPGIVVEADDLTTRGGDVKIRDTATQVPVALTISVSGRVRGGSVMARYPRRTFWQWLRREPRPYRALTA
jgi:hypothetical protein